MRFPSPDALRQTIRADLQAVAGAPVAFAFGLPPVDADAANDALTLIDDIGIAPAHFGPPDAGLLAAATADAGDAIVEEILRSDLLKSNCPVTGQPDWASVRVAYRGGRIDRAALLRYLLSFREHCEFHEQCVERIFRDVLQQCRPQRLSVEARYTRRGGLDIVPWRATPGFAPPASGRDARQ